MRFVILFLALFVLLSGCLVNEGDALPSPTPIVSSTPPPSDGFYQGIPYSNTFDIVQGFVEMELLSGALSGEPVFGDSRDPSKNRLFTLYDASYGELGAYYVWTKRMPAPSTPTTDCIPSDVFFGDIPLPSELRLSETHTFRIPVRYAEGTCPDSEFIDSVNVSLFEGNRFIDEMMISQLDSGDTATLKWTPDVDGVHELTARLSTPQGQLRSNDEVELELSVLPLGVIQESHEWLSMRVDRSNRLAQKFDVASTVRIKSIVLRVRRLSENPAGEFTVQIRHDALGKPSGSVLFEARRGMVILPSDFGDARFGFPTDSTLPKGTYWIVVMGANSLTPFEVMTLNLSYPGSLRTMGDISTPPQVEDWMVSDSALYFGLSGLPA
ncbi:hypothetical protein KJ765_01750 [Candidatus Micrarchaeota archaeon]|nr:hypothetical protein [Candidatus Micrarchaeota archaeon]